MKTLYKKDSHNKVRVWNIWTENEMLIQESGILDGKLVQHSKQCKAKNVGKSNGTSPEEQALLELESEYKGKLSEGYFETIDEAQTLDIDFRPMKGLIWADQKKKPSYPLLGSYKMDGACAYLENGILKSFTGELWVACPHISESLLEFSRNYPEIILHGEFYNHDYSGKFNELMSLIRKQSPNGIDLTLSKGIIQFHIHDMFNKELPELKAFERIGFLQNRKPSIESYCVVLSLQKVIKSDEEFDTFHKMAVRFNYEGTVVRPDVAYTPNKKGKGFFKRKDYQDAEFELIDFLEGEGNWAGKAKRAIVKMLNGKECGVGVSGTYEQCEEYLTNKYNYIGKQATVTFLKFTPDGLLREGILKDVGRPD